MKILSNKRKTYLSVIVKRSQGKNPDQQNSISLLQQKPVANKD